jgi:sugar lactone lactonase YvrE
MLKRRLTKRRFLFVIIAAFTTLTGAIMKNILRSLSILTVATFSVSAVADTPILIPAWQSEAVFEGPESIVFDKKNQLFYLSNVNGSPMEADGNGYISTLSLDGKLINKQWVSGLNAPKGLTLVNNTLYAADMNELVVIDIKSKKVTARYKDKNAKFLNDVVADNQGNVYVSDMVTDKLHKFDGKNFNVWIDDAALENPNGLLVEGGNLLVGSWGVMTDGFATAVPGHLKTINLKTKSIQSLGDRTPAGNLDGVEADGEGNYFVTDWMSGKLLHITPAGISKTLITLGQGSADHTVVDNLVVIPMMLDGIVTAFEVKQ